MNNDGEVTPTQHQRVGRASNAPIRGHERGPHLGAWRRRDRAGRGFIGRNSIALTSPLAEGLDQSSAGWLGRHAGRTQISQSGLWNIDHIRHHREPGSSPGPLPHYPEAQVGSSEVREDLSSGIFDGATTRGCARRGAVIRRSEFDARAHDDGAFAGKPE